MLTGHFKNAIEATNARADANAVPVRLPDSSANAFSKAASLPLLPKSESEYLQFLNHCASTYARMDALADRLATFDRYAGRALRLLETRARDRQDQIEALRLQAARSPDGRRVYLARDRAGGLYESGDPLSPQTFARTLWGRRPTIWGDYCHAVGILDAVLVEHGAVSDYRERIGAYRRRLLRDEPLPDAFLTDLEHDIERMPEAVRRQMPSEPDVTSDDERATENYPERNTAPAARPAFNHAARGAVVRARASGRGSLGPAPRKPLASPGASP
jgi:hypothetical protein